MGTSVQRSTSRNWTVVSLLSAIVYDLGSDCVIVIKRCKYWPNENIIDLNDMSWKCLSRFTLLYIFRVVLRRPIFPSFPIPILPCTCFIRRLTVGLHTTLTTPYRSQNRVWKVFDNDRGSSLSMTKKLTSKS